MGHCELSAFVRLSEELLSILCGWHTLSLEP